MTKPMTDEELQSFYEYAGANMVEPDGSQCQWADYSTRCVEEIRRLREKNERLEKYCKMIDTRMWLTWRRRESGFLDREKTSDEANDARCVEEIRRLREKNAWIQKLRQDEIDRNIALAAKYERARKLLDEIEHGLSSVLVASSDEAGRRKLLKKIRALDSLEVVLLLGINPNGDDK